MQTDLFKLKPPDTAKSSDLVQMTGSVGRVQNLKIVSVERSVLSATLALPDGPPDKLFEILLAFTRRRLERFYNVNNIRQWVQVATRARAQSRPCLGYVACV